MFEQPKSGSTVVPPQQADYRLAGDPLAIAPTPSLGSTSLGWYAVYTIPRHEKRAAEHFAQRRIESFLPLYSSRRHWKDGSRKVLQLPLFPSYIFVRFALKDRFEVLAVPGVLSLVSAGTKPACLPDCEIEAMRTGLAGHNAEPHAYLHDGERVRIVRGPFAGMEGILEQSNKHYRIVMTLGQILQSFAIEIDASEAEMMCQRVGAPAC